MRLEEAEESVTMESHLQIPIAVAASPREEEQREKSETADMTPLTVLIVEDEPVIMQLMTTIISRDGHRVIAATDGEEALFLWASEHPQIVFMDVQMPNLDGLEATKMIRALEKYFGGQVPIYALTAHVMEEDVKRCLGAGMTGHIGKPIDFQQVRDAIIRLKTNELHAVGTVGKAGECTTT